MQKSALELAEKFKKEMAGKITSQEGTFSSFSYGSILPLGFPPFINRYYDFDFISFLFFAEEKYGGIFFNLPAYQQMTIHSYNRLIKLGIKNVPEFNGYRKVRVEIQDKYDKSNPEILESKDNNQLFEILKEAFELEVELFVTTVFSESMDEAMIKSLYEALKDKTIDFETFIKTATQPTFESFVTRYDKTLLEINKDSDCYPAQWVFSNYYITPDISEIKARVKQTIDEKGGAEAILSELKKFSDEIDEHRKNLEKFRESLSGEEQTLLDYVQLAMEVRDSRKEGIQQTLTILNNIARILFKRAGLKIEDLVFSFPHELFSGKYLEKGFTDELQKRKSGVWVYYNKDGWVISTKDYKKTKENIYAHIDKADGEVKEIKGNIGCKGKAEGKVNIILNEKDFSKFIPGSVLVTSMTRPEFVPIMKKSVAIITDEGGVTCHAAIVSRELNIPCIIGTKNATRLLKNGDLVEVDADKGVVKIL
ncbi:MAG: PEP-utilizing enzyme [Candidatus Paceibacterota bacterium]|jgi:phosphohistidine swiveling domain-containing protein